MNKSKVVILHHCDDLGGAGISLLNIYKMLKEEYEVKIYIPHADSEMGIILSMRNVPFNILDAEVGMISAYSGGPKIFSRTFAMNLIKINETKRILYKIIDKEKPDIFIVNSMTLAWVGRAIQRSKVKIVCLVRETYIQNLGMRLIKYYLNNYFDAVIFISEYDKIKFQCKASITEIVRDCENHEDYLINLTRNDACDYLDIKNNYFNVLFVGGTDELKGWSIIKSAMERLFEYDIQLIVAGKANIEVDKYCKNIKFIGARTDMPFVYRACDVLVFPSTSPHQARPIFEAGFAGLPVIISDYEETREFVNDGENGLTFRPNDPEDLARKIINIHHDKKLFDKLGKSNNANSIKNHEFNICKIKLIKTLDYVINPYVK